MLKTKNLSLINIPPFAKGRCEKIVFVFFHVIPAKAGTCVSKALRTPWTPVFTGVTAGKQFFTPSGRVRVAGQRAPAVRSCNHRKNRFSPLPARGQGIFQEIFMHRLRYVFSITRKHSANRSVSALVLACRSFRKW
jgi:hypothetical protein